MEWYEFVGEDTVPSPSLIFFRERIEANLARMIEIAGGPERLRPHVKTHKLAPLVRRQMELGITKFKCATIAEAEMCATAGAKDVLLAYPPAGPAIGRFCELMQEISTTRFSIIADNPVAIRALSVAARHAGTDLDVLLDIDCGMHRTGVEADGGAAACYRFIAEQPALRAAGLHAYDGHIHEPDLEKRTAECDAAFRPVVELRKKLEAEGLEVPVLVAGGTPTFAIHAGHADRELSPGTSVLWDFGYGDKFPDLPFQPAALLLARVVSKPGRDRLCLDLGHKAVASEQPHPRVRLLEIPDATFISHSEEHLVIESPDAGRFVVGSLLRGIPRHICPTVALHNDVVVVENRTIAEGWPVTARGRRISI